jgi:integrase
LPPEREAQVERGLAELRGERPAATAPERPTVRGAIDSWLNAKRMEVEAGMLSAKRVLCLGGLMAHVGAILGEETDPRTVNAESLDKIRNFALGKVAEQRSNPNEGWSAETAKQVFAVASSWVRWLWEGGTIELPRNLGSRRLTIPTGPSQIETWTLAEVDAVVGASRGRLRVALLLQLNCGMTQQDVADLLDEEVDWAEGRVIRRRSKTRRQKNAPTVNYPLWAETLELLRQLRSGKERVLVTEKGNPLVQHSLQGKQCRSHDMLGDAFRKLRGKLEVPFHKPMKLLRKTSASMLESHPTYGRLTTLFLGHSPASIKDKHYAQAPQALFDEAVTWLGQQFGFVQGKAEGQADSADS